jgi:type IX secretion system PorP/SprF family membrane protein
VKKLKYICILLFGVLEINAQEFPVIGQYIFNEMILNPASTGCHDVFNSQYSYRKQWLKVPGAPSTQSLALQSPLRDESVALGLLFYRDKIGVSSESAIVTNFAYRLKLGEEQRLVFGFGAGVYFEKINYTQLNLTHGGDMSFMSDSPLGISPNFSAGIRYEVEGLEFGVAIPMLLTTRYDNLTEGFQLMHRFSNYNYLLRSVYNYQVNKDVKMRFGGLFKYHQFMESQLDVTISAQIKQKVEFGGGFRSSEGIIVFSRLNIIEQLDFGIQYEIPTTKLYAYTSGTLEVSLIYNGLFNSQAKNPRVF